MIKATIRFFTSLRLTVALLAFSMVLVFFGTLDQVRYGIWHTQELYFESFLAFWAYPPEWPGHDFLFWLHLPIPGGYLLGGLLLVNLVAAHVYRFKLSWKKSGIALVHGGLILLLLSELLTDLMAEESQMPVDEGGRAGYSISYRENELVLIDRSPATYDEVHAVPVELLEPGRTVVLPGTLHSIRTVRFFPNALVGRAPDPTADNLADKGVGARMNLLAVPEEPVYSENDVNTATAYVEVLGPGGSLGTWLVSNVIDERFPPQTVRLEDGREWEIALRFRRHYHPFEVELVDFSHDKYPGTEIPFNFSSEVRLHHEDPGKDRTALIYMNHPLRYEGLTFYQASFANQDTTSIFQVVRNPGWLLPYVSVLLMGAGLLVQFGMHFFKFLRKRRA